MAVKKFGIIGCGMISTFHARAIRELGAELVACYDQLPIASPSVNLPKRPLSIAFFSCTLL